jgi:PhzF family phenazine biosynthesis protein
MRIFQVDAFTARPFAGNPAAVCLLEQPAGASWMQALAAEMNLSETAFLHPRPDGAFDLRWFTPVVEVDLCGHATLASAHVLWETGALAGDAVARFHTRSGVLSAVRQDDWIEMDFPATPAEPVAAPPDLLEALGVDAVAAGRTRFDYLVEVASEAAVRALQPDFVRLAQAPARGVMVTARAAEYDFVSRFFAPASGIAEDPVTGSAHCCLGPYWAARLGRTRFIAFQASRRGGIVRVALNGDRVLLGGQAVTVFRGELDRRTVSL